MLSSGRGRRRRSAPPRSGPTAAEMEPQPALLDPGNRSRGVEAETTATTAPQSPLSAPHPGDEIRWTCTPRDVATENTETPGPTETGNDFLDVATETKASTSRSPETEPQPGDGNDGESQSSSGSDRLEQRSTDASLQEDSSEEELGPVDLDDMIRLGACPERKKKTRDVAVEEAAASRSPEPGPRPQTQIQMQSQPYSQTQNQTPFHPRPLFQTHPQPQPHPQPPPGQGPGPALPSAVRTVSPAILSTLSTLRERAESIWAVSERLLGGSAPFAYSHPFAGIVQGEASLMRADAVRITEYVDAIFHSAGVTAASLALEEEEARKEANEWREEAERTGYGFEYMLDNLRRYKRRFGNCRVPSDYKSPDGSTLGRWVIQRRQFYRRFKKGKMMPGINEEKIAKLEALGFEWEVPRGKPLDDHKWDVQYRKLLAFKEKTGHTRVSLNSSQANYDQKLANFVGKQRYEYKRIQAGLKSSLSDRRKEKLEEIGFDWVVEKEHHNREKHDADWRYMFNQLRLFAVKNGHCRPLSHGETAKLARWTTTQRMRYWRRNKRYAPMSDERIAALESIGFEWQIPHGPRPHRNDDPEWDAMYEALQNYKRENGDCTIPLAAQGQHYKLHKWISNQRAKVQKLEKLGALTLARKDNAEEGGNETCGVDPSPGGWGVSVAERWEVLFAELREYALEHGHCRVKQPPNGEYSRLATWCSTQRAAWRKLQKGERSSMTEEKIRRLEELGFDWTPPCGNPNKKARLSNENKNEEEDKDKEAAAAEESMADHHTD